jgi:hypothetical protein
MADPTGSGSNGGTTTVVANPPNAPTTNTVPNTTTNTTTVQYQSAIPDPNGVLAAEDAQLAEQAAARSDAEAYDRLSTRPGNLNDPYAGLSPTQLQDLGGADPTDPYIRARLGIPQLPGSTLVATSGFGFGNLNTGLPSIDGALGTIKGLFGGFLGGGTGGGSGLSSLFTNFSATVGGLFGSKPIASATAATTGSGTSALVAPASPSTTLTPVDATTTEGFGIQAAVDPTTLEGFGVQASVDPTTLEGYGIQATVDPTTLEGYGVPTSTNTTTLNADQADAFYNGTGTLTSEQRLAQDQQTAADAAALYPGTNNTNLKNIDAAGGAIARNQVGITNAEQIIAEQNQELADPNISDERRAELEANNASQENYIRLANDNTAENELVIEANADGYAAGGGNPDSGQSPAGVAALTDPGLDTATQTNIISAENANDINAAEDEALSQDEAAAFENQRVGPRDPTGVLAAEDEALAQDEADAFANQSRGPADPTGVLAAEDEALAQEAIAQSDAEAFDSLSTAPTNVSADEDAALFDELATREDRNAAINTNQASALADQEQGSQQSAFKDRAQKQSTIQARYKQPGNTDWRVRLSLGPNAQYLYNANDPGILAPLKAGSGTDGVIFPYTPNITTTYSANYEQYDLVHSNYRGLFYKNSRVGDIQIRGTFTAQNTTEANYLLAVIHFFRSATKMFYGQDPQRGTPPPICLLNGFGGYQFSDHPVVISSFNYTLPNDVDYIRTTNPNNFGLNLNNRYNPSGASLPAGGSLAGLTRLANALLPKGAQTTPPGINTVSGSVTNNTPASYVPTKMEIDITLIPAQTRSQVSKQFSLAGFAHGKLLEGGFW